MAVRYAVASGNWSDTATWNGGTLPGTGDDVYSNNFTVTIDVDFTILSLRNETASGITIGGGFILNNDRTITCTGLGIRNANTTCLTFSLAGTSYINSKITNNGASHCVVVNSTGILYIVGEITNTSGNGWASINTTAACQIYITGDVRAGATPGGRVIQLSAGAICNITGNVTTITASNANVAIYINANSACYITGNVFIESSAPTNQFTIVNANYLNIVGTLDATSTNGGRAVVNSTGSTNINLFSGPFVSSPEGILPFQVVRMHYIITFNSYFEFRDSSNDGSSSVAPATRLVSPDTAVDAPIPTNVRDGISYAFGAFTGTLKVPSPNSVALGVPTDNTVGNAVLTPQAVWDYATANLTDANSIGARLKNVSTVDTTGEQLEALL